LRAGRVTEASGRQDPGAPALPRHRPVGQSFVWCISWFKIAAVFCKCEIFGIFEDSRGIFEASWDIGGNLWVRMGVFFVAFVSFCSSMRPAARCKQVMNKKRTKVTKQLFVKGMACAFCICRIFGIFENSRGIFEESLERPVGIFVVLLTNAGSRESAAGIEPGWPGLERERSPGRSIESSTAHAKLPGCQLRDAPRGFPLVQPRPPPKLVIRNACFVVYLHLVSRWQPCFALAKSLESLRIPGESLGRRRESLGAGGPLTEPETCDKRGITRPASTAAKMWNHETYERHENCILDPGQTVRGFSRNARYVNLHENKSSTDYADFHRLCFLICENLRNLWIKIAVLSVRLFFVCFVVHHCLASRWQPCFANAKSLESLKIPEESLGNLCPDPQCKCQRAAAVRFKLTWPGSAG
jgi:hypothetical protein